MSDEDEAPDRSDRVFDPSGERERRLGEGLFEQDMGPSSSMAHRYRGEVHRMTRWRERLPLARGFTVFSRASPARMVRGTSFRATRPRGA